QLSSLDIVAQVDAYDDDTIVFENEDTTGNVADNDILPFGQNATFTVIEGPQNGTFVFTSGGNYIYSPPLNDFGFIDSVYYQVCVNGVCDIAGIGFYVIFRNTQPFANDDFFSVELNTPRTADVTLNDGDPDSVTDPLSTELQWYKFTNPTNGIVNSFSITGTFTYTPNAGFTGNDAFQYYVVDHCGLTEYATVSLSVIGSNLGPTASNQTITTLNEDESYSGSLQSLVTDPENDPLYFSVVSQPTSGTLQLSSNGIYTYTPIANFTGTIDFTYNACDIVGQCAQGLVTLTVNNTDNDAPTLLPDTFTLNEDSPGSVNVSLNDSDDSAALTYSIFSQASNGIVNLVSNAGTFSYSPAFNYSGADSFVVQACDGVNCATSIVTVQVSPVNDIPTASPFSITLQEDTNSSGTINSFTDVESPNLTYSVAGTNTIAGLTISSNGNYTYTAPANYFGSQTINIQACDAQNLCATSTFTLQVNAVNDLPIATNDAFSGNEDQTISGILSNGEYDIEGGPLTYSAAGNVSNGILSLLPNGQFTFTPNTNWFGTQSVTINVCDNQNGCVTTQLTLNIISINDTPVALPANLATNEDTNLAGNLSAFATDIESSQLTFTLLTPPASGQLTVNSNGSFTYNPASNFSGNTSATYQACDAGGSCVNGTIFITINPVNDAPTAPNITLTLTEDQPVVGTITSIQDIDNSSVTITINQNQSNGIFTINNAGNYTFTPANNYFGSDVVTYTACDASNACSQGNIFLVVQAVEDLPVVNDETIVIIQDNELAGNLSTNDSDGDGDALLYSNSTQAANGTINLAANGAFTYIPNIGFVGTEIINYAACDPQNNCANGVLTISVLTSNTAPVASNSNLTTAEDNPLLSNLFSSINDSEGGPFTFTTIDAPQYGSVLWSNNGAFTYTPQANYFGNDSFIYQACDAGNLCSQATVFISIATQNDSPFLAADELYILEDNTLVVNISENDADVEGQAISYQLTSTNPNGTASLTSTGLLSFIPNANYSGIVTLTYNGCDLQGACTNGIFTIYVMEISDTPIATSLSIFTSEDNLVSGNVSDYTSDVDSDIIYFGTLTNPLFGSVSMQTDGTFSYTPNANFFGSDQFIYYAADDFGMSDTSVVYIQITSVNDAPDAEDDAIETQEDETVSFNIGSNDTDTEN
ncbi:MAG: Ig-like domain-containing protein, partial [Flavobacteriales bacterium]